MQQHECELLHDTTLRILEEIGIRLEHDEIVELMLKAGAKPGIGAQEVRFPREMVWEYMALAPSEVQLAARDGSTAVLTPKSDSVCWTNPAMNVYDGRAWHDATSDDLATVARLCDNLEHVQGVMGVAMVDVPPPCRDFVGLRVMAENCRKHLRVLCFSALGAQALVEMKGVFPGAWFSVGFTAHGPLRWTHLALEIFRNTAGHGIPATINGEPMAGVTGPISLPGSMAVGNAEILAGIIINQVLEPGRPVIHNLGLAHAFDMRHATAITGGPENALFAKAAAAMGRFYRLPSASWVSTESVYEDGQASLEKMFGFSTHMADRVSLIWGMGQLESEKTTSLGQLVSDNEMIGYIRRYQRGFDVTEEQLQYDLIREVGIAGSYLETDHTLENFREQLFEPRILNRRVREECPLPLADAAHRRAAEILAADTEEKIETEAATELRRVETAYRQQCATG